VIRPNDRLQSEAFPEPDKPDDIALVSFLKDNAPAIPEPGLAFEDRLMQAISKEPSNLALRQKRTRPRPKYRWNSAVAVLIGLGVGAITIGLGQLHQWFTSPQPSAAEVAQLESFIINDWDETVRPSETLKEWN
jgi:hypothetical protein